MRGRALGHRRGRAIGVRSRRGRDWPTLRQRESGGAKPWRRGSALHCGTIRPERSHRRLAWRGSSSSRRRLAHPGSRRGRVRTGARGAVTVTGTLTVQFASPHGAADPVIILATDAGDRWRLDLDESVTAAGGGLLALDRKKVEVTGALTAATGTSGAQSPVISASAIRRVAEPGAAPGAAPEALTGSQSFVPSCAASATPPASRHVNRLLRWAPGPDGPGSATSGRRTPSTSSTTRRAPSSAGTTCPSLARTT